MVVLRLAVLVLVASAHVACSSTRDSTTANDNNNENRAKKRRKGLRADSADRLAIPMGVFPVPVDPNPQIMGGIRALKDRYPYMAEIYSIEGHHGCGLALVGPDVLVTAAHCVEDDFSPVVKIGMINSESQEAEALLIREIALHPRYSKGAGLNNDLAVVSIFGKSSNMPVRVNIDNNAEPSVAGETLRTMGWGLVDKNGNTDEWLRQIDVSYIPNKQCSKQKHIGKLTDSMMCVGPTVGQGTCRGDSGSPLIKVHSLDPNNEDPQHDILLGVTSWGQTPCTVRGSAEVFARISDQGEWIRDQVCRLSLDPPSYFKCPPRTLPALGNSQGMISLTISIYTDKDPRETGWVLQSIDEDGVYEIAMPKTYKKQKKRFTTTVEVPREHWYRFGMVDTWNDGVMPGGGYSVKMTESGKVLAEYRADKKKKFMVHEQTFAVSSVDTTIPPTPTPLSFAFERV